MLNRLSISEALKLLNNREISSVELTESYLEEIKNRENEINAYITVTKELALEKARGIDKQREKGINPKPLAGIPGGIKDNIYTRGILTTCGSKILSSFIPDYNATVIDRLQDSGYVMLGKLNMDEFGIGGGGEYSYFGPTANPHDLRKVPGGSSSGSAASVAAYESAFSLGTDTGGSVLKPAAYCGVVGIKPTFGTISRFGTVGFAPTFEQIGVITRSVEDNAIVLNTIAGFDSNDPATVNRENIDYTEEIGMDIKGLKIAIPRELMEADNIQLSVRKIFDDAIKRFKDLGCSVELVSMPSLKYAISAYYILTCAESVSQLAKYTDRSDVLGKEVKRRIIFGNYVLSEKESGYHRQALKIRTLIKEEYERVFKKYNLIITPASIKTPGLIGEIPADPADVYRTDIFNMPINLAGVPSLCVPCGKTTDNLPTGLLLTGSPFSEKLLYRAGHALEKK